MADQPSRKRRFARRAVLVATGLLPVWYVGAWLFVSWTFQDECPFRWASRPFVHVTKVFFPLVKYCESDLPGADLLGRLWWRVNAGQTTLYDNKTSTGAGGWPIAPTPKHEWFDWGDAQQSNVVQPMPD